MGVKNPVTGSARGRRGRGRSDTRLSLGDWTAAALDLLVREGVSAVKITRLCDDLGVTKGSFYWHFADLNALMEAVADRWCAEQHEAVRVVAQLQALPVDVRLEKMAELLMEQQAWAVQLVVRDWATGNEQVAASVREMDQQIFEVVRGALLGLGFDAEQARLRAGVLVYAGIGFVFGRTSLPTPTAAELDAIMEILTTR
ncbi:TetR/AcrR family transcriptional regulator [Rhodococcus sp. D2-41]|uniref:TetR/AcrR family transcriptional regulator n=1 Tax=Speluncibacter jeojiensis TaxID=2710754 RepID=UPI00240F6EBD|nr:TetR/AcrR family transcriptional regulator [Rhodococcus sp. D2-41]MDG3012591.1 TetR/AcrR family transcriptional regulator [Rhodococcus sp. D2-41]